MKNSKACVTCRNRKVKCDKEMPVCSTCSKRGSLCSYEDKRWRIKSIHHKRDHKKPALTDKICNSYDEYGQEEIDFYSNTFQTPLCFSEGPLTWVSFAKKDRFLNIVVLTHRIKNNLKDEKFEQNVSHVEFIKKWNNGFDELFLNSQDELTDFNGGDLIKNVENLLSNSKIVWVSIEKFFESECYMFFPFIDKDDFIEKLVQLIGSPNYNDTPIKLTINKSINFAYIGILLMIMRLISLSYYNFGKGIDIDANTISFIEEACENISLPVYHNLISRIYLELSIIKPPSLEIFQFISMKFFFDLYSPEEYDCLNIANCSKLGELIQYGIQCSLNIDPIFINKEKDNNSLHNLKRNNLSRRLWYMVVCFDFLKNVNSGYPVLIDETTYNTELPSSDSTDSEIDRVINTCLAERVQFFHKVKPLLKLILNLKEKVKIEELDRELKSFLDFIEDLPSLESTLKEPSNNIMEKTLNLKNFMTVISINTLLFTIYYHLFIFYSEKRSVPKALFYLIEIIKVAKILYKPLLFIDPNSKNFNLHTQFGSPILSFPTLEVGFHKATSIFFGILSRIKALKISKGGHINHSILIVLDQIVDTINEAFLYMLQQFINSSDVYFHTWLLSKIQLSVVFKILRVPKGAFLYSDLAEADVHFKQALSRTAGETKTTGDLGFENFTADDLRKILHELKGLQEIYNYADPLNKWSILKNEEVITENDKKWIKRMLHQMGHGLTNSFNIKKESNNSNKDSVDCHHKESSQDSFEKKLDQLTAEYVNSESLDFELNGSELDNMLNFGVTTFFGINDNDNCWHF